MPRIIGLVLLLLMMSPAWCQSAKVKRLTSVNDSYPALSPDGSTLLFQSDRTGDVEIWSMKIDGTDLKRITSTPGYDGNPAWSPDGKMIAFASARDKDLEIYTMSTDGARQTRLTTTPGNDGHPHWYPDGSRIIFNSARTSPNLKERKTYDEIFSMKPDGSEVRQITNLKSVATYASVSPDGTRIVFRGSIEGPAYGWDMSYTTNTLNSEILVMTIDGNDVINLTQSPAFDGWPMWSPDSKKVIFASNRSGKPNSGQLYSVNPDGSALSQLTDLPGAVAQPAFSADGKFVFGYQLWETDDEHYGHIVQLTVRSYSPDVIVEARSKFATTVIDSYPMMSPDGSSFAFHSNRTGDWEVYVANADGSKLRQITNVKGPDQCPVWSPDGTKIIFASERDSDPEIYIMNADGSGQTRLTKTPGDDSHPHWYPDGSRIIFNSARDTPDLTVDWGKQHLEVYSMKSDGSDVRKLTDLKTISTYPSVSPDGKKIAFRRVTDGPAVNWDMTSNRRSRNSDVFVMSIDSKDGINLSAHAAFDGWPSWSPDSKRIVFSSNRNGKVGGGQLFVINADGTGLTQLTDLSGALVQPTWSPDGKSILAFQCWEGEGWEFGNVVRIEVVK